MTPQAIIAHLGELAWPKALVYGVVLAAAYYFLIFNDGSGLQQQLDGAGTDLTTAKRGLEQTKKAVADADKFEKKITTLALEFKKIRDFMPDGLGPSGMTEIVSQQATASGAVVSKMEPVANSNDAVDEKADFYDATRMGIALEGSYAQLAKFFSNLSKLPKILTFENMKIVEVPGGDIEHPKLAMTGVLVGYRYKAAKDPDSAEKLDKDGKPIPPTGAGSAK